MNGEKKIGLTRTGQHEGFFCRAGAREHHPRISPRTMRTHLKYRGVKRGIGGSRHDKDFQGSIHKVFADGNTTAKQSAVDAQKV